MTGRLPLFPWILLGAALLGVWATGAAGQGHLAQGAAGGLDLPGPWMDRLGEDPEFFRVEKGWVHRTLTETERGAPLSGTLPVLLIQGLFADSPEPHVTVDDLRRALFDGPSPFGTLREYYQEVSGGRLLVTGEVLPWIRTGITRAQAVGASYGLGDEAGTGSFLLELVQAVDPEVDFGRFDNDGPDGEPNSGDDDGFVDAVAFHFLEVSASCGGPGIWPHRSRVEYWTGGRPFVSNDVRTGGGFIRVNDYTIQSAVDCGGLKVQKATTISHELGHVLGLPDLYDRSQGLLPQERRWVVGCWSLMAAGTWGCGTESRLDWVRPTHLGAWEKLRLGWLESVRTVGEGLDQQFILHPVQSHEEVLQVPLEAGPLTHRTEYLLMEYRTRTGFDVDLPASGVLVYHVNPEVKGNMPCDTCPQEYMVELLEADGNNSLRLTLLQGGNRGEAGDAWGMDGPGTITNNTYPSTRKTSGDPSPVTIYEIALEGGTARITLSTLRLPRERLTQPFLGSSGPALSQEEVAYLDSRGNGNGLYDVGDLRAYLKR